MGRLDGKVAYITGAARGQGRSHAVLLAEEGADIIGVDLCGQVDSVNYPMSSPDDLEETVRLVEATGRRMVARQGDVRDHASLRAPLDVGLEEFGRLDIVLANAGIMPFQPAPYTKSNQAWHDSIDICLTGVWNTLQVTVPVLVEAKRGGAIVITSSTGGLRVVTTNLDGGMDGYSAAKFGVIGLMRAYAGGLAKHMIRVNSVHPTGVATGMVVNDFFPSYLDDEHEVASGYANAMPVPMIEPIDVSRAIMYLVSDDGRYVTGHTLTVDAGATTVAAGGKFGEANA